MVQVLFYALCGGCMVWSMSGVVNWWMSYNVNFGLFTPPFLLPYRQYCVDKGHGRHFRSSILISCRCAQDLGVGPSMIVRFPDPLSWGTCFPAQTVDILLDQDEGSQTENIHLIRIFKLPLSLRFKLKNFFVPFQTDNEHITQFLFVAREALKHYFRWER